MDKFSILTPKVGHYASLQITEYCREIALRTLQKTVLDVCSDVPSVEHLEHTFNRLKVYVWNDVPQHILDILMYSYECTIEGNTVNDSFLYEIFSNRNEPPHFVLSAALVLIECSRRNKKGWLNMSTHRQNMMLYEPGRKTKKYPNGKKPSDLELLFCKVNGFRTWRSLFRQKRFWQQEFFVVREPAINKEVRQFVIERIATYYNLRKGE